MSAEENGSVLARIFGELCEGIAQAVRLGFDEFWMIEAFTNFFNERSSFADGKDRICEVFAVLAATAVATEHGSEERDCAASAVLFHLRKGVVKQWMPVAITPVDWEGESTAFAFRFDGSDQSAALFVDGADTSEMLVVFGDFEHPFAGYIFSPQDVFQKGEDIIGAFWATEGDE